MKADYYKFPWEESEGKKHPDPIFEIWRKYKDTSMFPRIAMLNMCGKEMTEAITEHSKNKMREKGYYKGCR